MRNEVTKKVPIEDNTLKLDEFDQKLFECSDKEIKKSSKSKNRSNKVYREKFKIFKITKLRQFIILI